MLLGFGLVLFVASTSRAEETTGLEDLENLGAGNWHPEDVDKPPGKPVTVTIAEVPAFGDRPGFRHVWTVPTSGRYTLRAAARESFDYRVVKDGGDEVICRGEDDEFSCDLGELTYGERFVMSASRYIGYGPAHDLRVEVLGPPRPASSREWHDRRDALFTHARPLSLTGSFAGLQLPMARIDGVWRGGFGYSAELGILFRHVYVPLRYRYLALAAYKSESTGGEPEFGRTVHALDVGLGFDTYLGTPKWSLLIDGFVSPQAWWATGFQRPEGVREKNALGVGVHATLSLWRTFNFSVRVERVLGEDSMGAPASWIMGGAFQLVGQFPAPVLPRDLN